MIPLDTMSIDMKCIDSACTAEKRFISTDEEMYIKKIRDSLTF